MSLRRLAVAVSLAAAPLAAQDPALPTTPRFVEILRLAQDGRADSARVLINRYLEATPAADAAYPEGLYTAATVARTGDQARLLFSRVVVEYATSAWADRALLRLAQLDYGTGDTQGAVARVTRLMADYPLSPVLPTAALWGARAAFERRDGTTACAWLTRGLERVGDDVELKNQLEFTRQRCTTLGANATPQTPAPTTTTPRSAPTPTEPRPEPVRTPAAADHTADAPPASPWRVQVAALSDPAAIRRVEDQIRRAGLSAYKVPGPNGLTKLQAGPFATREAAQAKVAALAAAVGGTPFVTRAP